MIWQIEIVAKALASNSITEDQALLLGMLYYHADWSTRVLSDFRAERACEWMGHDLGYTRSMQRRLHELKEMGWFTWTYVKGTKTPYDITMRPEYAGEVEGGAPPTVDDRHGVTVSASATVGDGVESNVGNLILTKVLDDKTQATLGDGGAPQPDLVANLRAAIYKATEGEMVDRLLTPDQVSVLLETHTVEEIVYAIRLRREKISDRRELHRSFGWFLRDGGIKIELDARHAEVQSEWADQKSTVGIGQHKFTSSERADFIEVWIDSHATEIKMFPDLRESTQRVQGNIDEWRVKRAQEIAQAAAEEIAGSAKPEPQNANDQTTR
jgi:hypothetical protein